MLTNTTIPRKTTAIRSVYIFCKPPRRFGPESLRTQLRIANDFNYHSARHQKARLSTGSEAEISHGCI